MKKCTKCKIEKSESEFYKRANGMLRADCKDCHKLRAKKYNSIAEVKERRKMLGKLWRKNNPEKSAAIYERYRKTEKRKSVSREWARRNLKTSEKRFVERYHSDPQFNLAIKFRRRIYMAIRGKYTEKAKTTIELLGTTYPKLKEHIEAQFRDGMTWEKLLSGEIHIDHIIPLASAKDLDELVALCHYSNLQPLWAVENRLKSDKVLIKLR